MAKSNKGKGVAVRVTKGNADAKKKIHASPWLSVDAVDPVRDIFKSINGGGAKKANNPEANRARGSGYSNKKK